MKEQLIALLLKNGWRVKSSAWDGRGDFCKNDFVWTIDFSSYDADILIDMIRREAQHCLRMEKLND